MYDSSDGASSEDFEEEGTEERSEEEKAAAAAAAAVASPLKKEKEQRKKRARKRKKLKKAHNAGWLQVLGVGGAKGLLDSPLLGGGSTGALHDERVRLLQEEAQRGLEAEEAAAEALESRKARPTRSQRLAASLNPLAGVLGSVQPHVGRTLRTLRHFKRVLV